MNISRTQKIIAGLVVAAVLILGGFAYWYNTTLENSKKELANAPSRAIDSKNNAATKTTNKAVTPGSITPDPLPKPGVISQPDTEKLNTVKKGTFGTLDPAHYAKGEAKIMKSMGTYTVELSDDFSTNPDGPDLYVWLVKEQKLGGAIGGVNTDPSMYLNLGPLTSKNGKQWYSITEQEAKDFGYAVVIWCKAFNVQFSNAVLQ
jgi:hypothetical protein